VVEAILVVPVLMVTLLVVIQFALWAHAAQVVQLAASEGDRTARSLDGGAAAGVAQAQSVMRGPGSDLATSSVAVDVVPGDLARVTITGHAVSIIPGLSLPVSSIEIGPIQEFRGSE
jgi:Flp pilus assembly protein TadG